MQIVRAVYSPLRQFYAGSISMNRLPYWAILQRGTVTGMYKAPFFASPKKHSQLADEVALRVKRPCTRGIATFSGRAAERFTLSR
jgi:hypothetical protein